MSEQCKRQQQYHPRPSRSEREQRRISTQVNQLANRLLQVNQDFLNLARMQLEAFNTLQRYSRQQRNQRRSRSHSRSLTRDVTGYKQRPFFSDNRTPPTPRRPSSSPEPTPEDSETLENAQEPHNSPTPSVISWSTYQAENHRQITDRYVPSQPRTVEYPRTSYRGRRPRRASQLAWQSQYQAATESTPSREDRRSGSSDRARGQRGRRRPHSLHDQIRF